MSSILSRSESIRVVLTRNQAIHALVAMERDPLPPAWILRDLLGSFSVHLAFGIGWDPGNHLWTRATTFKVSGLSLGRNESVGPIILVYHGGKLEFKVVGWYSRAWVTREDLHLGDRGYRYWIPRWDLLDMQLYPRSALDRARRRHGQFNQSYWGREPNKEEARCAKSIASSSKILSLSKSSEPSRGPSCP